MHLDVSVCLNIFGLKVDLFLILIPSLLSDSESDSENNIIG